MKSLANILTTTRLIVLPFFLFAILTQNLFQQLIFFAIIILSDYFDGVAARTFGGSRFGRTYDPLADMLVISLTLATFALQNAYLLIPLTLFLLRDLGVFSILLFAKSRGIVTQADAFGKIKTATQFILILALIFNHSSWFILTWIAILLSVCSGLNYLRLMYKLKDTPSHFLLENTNSRSFTNPFKLYSYEQFKGRQQKFLTQHEVQNNTVFIAGGDGFFHVVLNKPWAKNQRLGFYPMGGGNALRSVFYRPKLFQTVIWKNTQIDTFRLNGKRALFAGIGYDADMIKYSPRIWPAILGYCIGITRAFTTKRNDYVLTLDGKGVEVKAANIAFTKVPDIGYWLRDIQTIEQNDGYVYVIVSQTKLNRMLIPLFHAFKIAPPNVSFYKAKHITVRHVHNLPISAHIAGDYEGECKEVIVAIDEPQEIICAQ
jgi:CDP-diacylglycerol---glycerol-3-phosphate 3-phosphatidyltransferase